MTMYEQDPDVVRWGLHLLDICSFTNRGSPCPITRYDEDPCHIEHVSEGYFGPGLIVENDEVIASALQEELTRLPDAEASGSSRTAEEHQQASFLAQDWLGPSKRHHYPGQEVDERKELSLCPSPTHISVDGEDLGFPEIADESSIDGEVGKRLNQMIPVPHVPRINREIPSVDEATSDHQRLLDRLQLYDLVELKVLGDGNCQFRSLSDQIYRSPEHHKFVRQQVIDQLKSHREYYESYVPMDYDDYLKKMSRSSEWGDHVTLQAASDSYGVKIFVITSFKDTCYMEILPRKSKSNRIIFLSFWAEVHYNSIYPEGDFPELDNKKKKKWWLFGG